MRTAPRNPTAPTRRLLTTALLAVAAALPWPAAAQSRAGEPGAAPTANRTVRTMFAWADRNQDGHLTRTEARGRLPLTHKNFATIDSAHRGWISFEQFVAFTDQRVGKQADDILKIGEWL